MQIIPRQPSEIDYIHEYADAELEALTKELQEIYKQAYEEVKKKADEYLEQYREADEEMRLQYESGEITKKDWENWRRSHMMTGQRWYTLADSLATDMTNADLIATSIINGHLPQVYALGYNYSVYETEKETLFEISDTLYSRRAVERAIRNHSVSVRTVAVDVGKSYRWNQQHVTSATVQGILQGEDPRQIAARIARTTEMDYSAALRNARTAFTSAENGGRYEAYKDSEAAGFKVYKTWIATLDGRTRPTHRKLDRETVEGADTLFANECRYPGDPDCGDGSELYNCRCAMIRQVVKMDLSVKAPLNGKLGDMEYDEWKNAKGDEAFFKRETNRKSDKEQYEKYKGLKVDGVPKSFKEFQDIKYESPAEWKKIKSDALSKQAKQRKEAKDNGKSANNGK